MSHNYTNIFPKAQLDEVLVILGNDPDEEVNMLRSFKLIFAPTNTKLWLCNGLGFCGAPLIRLITFSKGGGDKKSQKYANLTWKSS